MELLLAISHLQSTTYTKKYISSLYCKRKLYRYRISLPWLLAAHFCVAIIRGWLLFKGSVQFFGKPADINNGLIRYVQALQRWLLGAVSSLHSLLVLLSAMGMSRTTGDCHHKVFTHVCCIHQPWLLFYGGVLIMLLLFKGRTIRGWHLFEEIQYSTCGNRSCFFLS